MLVLTRKPDETIVIDRDIVITLIAVRGNKARIGINAPRHIPVNRSEVQAAITATGALPQGPGGAPFPRTVKPVGLVLSRQEGEKIVIGDNIELKVVRINKDRVRIGIAAPKYMSVRRGEKPEVGKCPY